MSRRPSRRLPVVLACLGTGWIILVALAEYALPGERVWLIGEWYDAGQVRVGTWIRHRVWLMNPSLRRLQVEVQPTCGCTAVGLREGVLPPLGIRQVQLQVDTEGRMPGRQQEAVDIILRTEDASWRERLTVRFTVVGPQGQQRES
ncbi:MAG: hypothetical protein ACP5RN_15280 [Armatimonadota bacterium]